MIKRTPMLYGKRVIVDEVDGVDFYKRALYSGGDEITLTSKGFRLARLDAQIGWHDEDPPAKRELPDTESKRNDDSAIGAGLVIGMTIGGMFD